MDAQRLPLGQSESHALKKEPIQDLTLISFRVVWTIYFVKTRITDVVDATDHGRANVVVIPALEIAVKESPLSQTIHGLLMIFVRHGEIGLQRC